MESAEIRSRFLRFFETRGHTVVPSAPLPLADPTLLLVNAGMVPFKPYFLGEQTPPYPRAASVQKCVRTLDIDEVGKTTRHGSFFQMAGNFSFGDYFKEGAIPLAWELLTNSTGDGGFGFAEDRLWVTVYDDDDEAAEIWHRDVGVPRRAHPAARPERQLLAHGGSRPGRPVLGDLLRPRSRARTDGGPIVDEERFLEVWNLVFMQYALTEVRRKDDFDIAGELPAKNIDTGMGLERMAAAAAGRRQHLRDRHDAHDHRPGRRADRTPLRRRPRRRRAVPGGRRPHPHRPDADRRPGRARQRGSRLRPASDHAPGDPQHAAAGVVRPHDARADVSTAIEAMGPQYPELEIERSRIFTVAEAEEAAFAQTLRTGTQIFDVAAARAAGVRRQDRWAATPPSGCTTPTGSRST